MRRLLLIAVLCACLPCMLQAQDSKSKIRLNQIGFYPDGAKIAVITDVAATDFKIISVKSGEVILKSKLSAPRKSALSDKMTRIADFSAVQKPGLYKLNIAEQGDS